MNFQGQERHLGTAACSWCESLTAGFRALIDRDLAGALAMAQRAAEIARVIPIARASGLSDPGTFL